MNRRGGEVATDATSGRDLDGVIPAATGDSVVQPSPWEEMGSDCEVIWLSEAAARMGGQTVWPDVNLIVRAGQFVAILTLPGGRVPMNSPA